MPKAKTKTPPKVNEQSFPLPKAGELFIVDGYVGEVLKINDPSAGFCKVKVLWEERNIGYYALWEQIEKDKWYFDPKEKEKAFQILSIKQELFCNYYVKNSTLRWNATLAYNEAYEMYLESKNKEREKDDEWNPIPGTSEYDKVYNTCSASASRLLKNVKIQERIQQLYNELLTDAVIDARLAEIILTWKHADSMNWIKEYNKMWQRITEKLEVKGAISLLDLHNWVADDEKQ